MLNELDRLKSLDLHHRQILQITMADPLRRRKSSKLGLGSLA